MTNQENRPMNPANLRQKAEALARERSAPKPEDSADLSPEEIRKTLHELRVHQIELEMQNEELRSAQVRIETGRDRYIDLYDLAPVGYCTLSEQGLILEANLTAATLLGVTRNMVIKQPISRFILKEDQDIYYLHSKKLFETSNPQECELRLLKPDDGVFWAHLRGTASQAEDGAPVCRVVISDITERKRAETYREMGREVLQILNEPGNLQESIQRVLAVFKTRTGVDAVGLRLQEGEDFPYFAQDGFSKDFLRTENTLLERGKDGDVCRDENGNVSLECTCGLVISGKTDPSDPLFTKGGSSWTNHSFTLLNLPSDEDPRLHPRNNCIHQGYASVALIPIRTSDRIVGLIQFNDKREGRFTLQTIEILEGIAAHIGSALMRKRAEEEKEKLQVQLIQAQKMESVGRLAGGVAHDFNNMLGVILGYVSLALDSVEQDDPLYADLEEIRKAAQRSADFTSQLLAFARKQTIAPKVLDLNNTVEGMLNMLRRLIGENIKLVWKPGQNLRPVKLDPAQIDQILANICVNARDAITGVGKISVETSNATLDEEYCTQQAGFTPGEYVKLSISDDGHGIDSKTLLLIFDPFFTTKEMGMGTGLGLATVYGIVKQNNGFINVYSEPGQGTTFNIYLPRHAAETEPLPEEAPDQAVSSGHKTILIAEDEPAILQMATIMLERQGYTVVAAITPDEAIRLAREHSGRIDLLLTDVVMPEMNGRDLADSILFLYPNLKCLFMSGYTANVIAHHGVLDEGDNFIQKPFSKRELTVKVQEVLDRD